jgi:hypothetical protein
MKSTKIPCSNVSTESYTGKEQSPKRFGLSAEGFDINYEKEGFDNLIWIVQIKNNRKVWVRKTNITKITHEEPILTQGYLSNDHSILNSSSVPNINNPISTYTITTTTNTLANTTTNTLANTTANITTNTLANTLANTTIIDDTEGINEKPEKKRTDYNIFIKYHLDKLKAENKDNTPHKILFQSTTQEWARLKKNPEELKTLMNYIKNK